MRGSVSCAAGVGMRRLRGSAYVAMACDTLVLATTGRCSPLASEVLEQLDLAEGALGEDLLAEDVGDLLDGDALAGLVVGSRAAGHKVSGGVRGLCARRTRRCRRHPDPAPLLHCTARRQ